MTIGEVEKEFNKTTKLYKTIRERCEKQTVREQWATGHIHELEPLETIRLGEAPGKPLNKKPASTNNKVFYAYDASGRIVIRRVGIKVRNAFYEEFFTYKEGRLDSAYFCASNMKELVNVKARSLNNECVEEIITVGKKGSRIQRFQYANGRVTQIDVEEFTKEQPESINRFHTVVTYDDGILTRIENIFPNGYRSQFYPFKD